MRLEKKISSILIIYLLLIAATANALFIDLFPKGTGFGNELVKQLKVKLTVNPTKGTSISIYFKYTKPH